MGGEEIYGSPEHQALRATVRKFVQAELAPRAREFDEMGRPEPVQGPAPRQAQTPAQAQARGRGPGATGAG